MRLRRGKARATGGVPHGDLAQQQAARGDGVLQRRRSAAGRPGRCRRPARRRCRWAGRPDGRPHRCRAPGRRRRRSPPRPGRRPVRRRNGRPASEASRAPTIGQGGPAQQPEIADGRQHRRRIGQGGQGRRIGGIAEHQEAAAELGERLFLAGDRGFGDRVQPRAGGARRAEMLPAPRGRSPARSAALRASRSRARRSRGIEIGGEGASNMARHYARITRPVNQPS